MKNILLAIFLLIPASLIYAQTSQDSQTDSIVFSPPKLVLEANAGDLPGDFGIWSNAGLGWPKDFIVDPLGAIWIMDIMNRRVQKFGDKGNFLLQFPNEDNSSPVKLSCHYIECDKAGNIFLGPVGIGIIVVIDNEGKLIRSYKVPGMEYTTFDFAVNSDGELIYKKGEDMVALNSEGKVLYAVKVENIIFLEGKHVSPYSAFIPINKYDKKQIEIFNGSFQEKKKIGTINMSYLENQEHLGKKNFILHADKDGNLFAVNNGNVSFLSPDGTYLQFLNKPYEQPEENIIATSYCSDKEGNFYCMAVQIPENAIIEEGKPKPLKSTTPCLRIWKWERIKQ